MDPFDFIPFVDWFAIREFQITPGKGAFFLLRLSQKSVKF